MEAAILLLQAILFFSSIWFCLVLFITYDAAPKSWRGSTTHEGPVYERMQGWWITEPVIFSGCSVAATAAFLLGVSL